MGMRVGGGGTVGVGVGGTRVGLGSGVAVGVGGTGVGVGVATPSISGDNVLEVGLGMSSSQASAKRASMRNNGSKGNRQSAYISQRSFG